MLGTAVALALTLLLTGGVPAVARAAIADFPQCSDGVDNDNDGRVDYPVDNDCVSIDDDNESIDTGVFVTVSDNRDQVNPGDAVVYNITLKQERDNVKLIDVALHLPAQSSIVYVSDAGTIVNGSAFWPKVAVFKGYTRTISVHVVTSPYVQDGQLLVARVTADAVQATDTTRAVRSNNIPYVQNQLIVSITDNRQNALPTDTLDYVISVRNPESRGTVVDVRAGIPIALSVLDATPSAEGFNRDLIWRAVPFAPNEEKIFSFRARVDSRVYNHYPIQVVARAGNVVAYDRTIVGSVDGGPYSLFSSITDGEQTARRGDLLTYVIHIDNISGRLDTNASVDASLPIHSEFVYADEGGRWDGKNVRWLNLQVAPGGSRDLRFTVRVRSDAPDGFDLRATSYVQGYTATDVTLVDDNRPATGSSTYSTYPGPRGTGKYPFWPPVHNAAGSPLSVTKTVDKTEASAGDIVTYVITVQNNTGTDLQNVLVTDNFNASQVTIRSRGTGTIDGDRIVWTIATLKDGENRTFTYTGKLSSNLQAGTLVVNTARAVSGRYDSLGNGGMTAGNGSSSVGSGMGSMNDGQDDLGMPSGSDDSSLDGSTNGNDDDAMVGGVFGTNDQQNDQQYVGSSDDQPQVTVMPRTGVSDMFYAPFSSDSNLSPIARSSSAVLLWSGIALMGLGLGGLLGHKFLA
jgi:uncharacterized repeat protein (TIGR01451 family)